MADDLNEKLNALLSNPDTVNMLGSLLGNSSKEVSENGTGETNSDDELISNIKSAVTRFSGGGDKRITLLNALRPYMRESRAANIDKAVKMLKLTQLTSIFKDL